MSIMLPMARLTARQHRGRRVDLELILRNARVQYLIVVGVCTDICVHTTIRDANDRGFECLLVEDATGATEQRHHDAAVTMVQTEVGLVGSYALIRAL